MRYNRCLLPSAGDEPHIVLELRRRSEGPICAQCGHSPLTEHDLPPLVAGDSRPASRIERTFRCEARGAQRTADGGHGCRHFTLRSRDAGG